ncbi:GNAT family N-acetyltransferase [Flagellimonas sediminis]|uniref:GNAT family N-acetyltransferase n=1 Tax=Flagellimonas sediminis TaxID=2696468 RepID=A0A6I5KPD5_9FLAO|nr:GNAT family N-acetyltransferase [Allomuricauda sediminis]NDV42407.1 GNAT family N-acetyltransferase [Allomuricauda sediminis]
MNQKIKEHLFDFWETIGTSGGFLKNGNGYLFTGPINNSWPHKTFRLQSQFINPKTLAQDLQEGMVPNSMVASKDEQGDLIKALKLSLTSSLSAMAMDTSGKAPLPLEKVLFERVSTKSQASIFADIASRAFGYAVLTQVLDPLIKNQNFKLFLGKHDESFACCGMIYLDREGNHGLHMIGTLPNFRGLGLGKEMTKFLLNQAIMDNSGPVYLIASVAGEKIYTKLGFKTYGTLETYTLAE